MRTTLFTILTLTLLFIFGAVSPVRSQDNSGCNLDDNTYQDIRRMFTAPDNGMFFEIWTSDELYCACFEILYNESPDEWLHERVAVGAVVIISQTDDPRTVDVLIDQIDKFPAQALYNLASWPTVDSVNALTANVRNDNVEARENAAEGLRNMRVPLDSEIQDGWSVALQAALDEVSDWITIEPEPDVREYFLDAHANLEILLEKAVTTSGTN